MNVIAGGGILVVDVWASVIVMDVVYILGSYEWSSCVLHIYVDGFVSTPPCDCSSAEVVWTVKNPTYMSNKNVNFCVCVTALWYYGYMFPC